MTSQPKPTHIIRPYPSSIPEFTIAPLERAATDFAANDSMIRRQKEFAEDGKSEWNFPMLACTIGVVGAVAVLVLCALYGIIHASIGIARVTADHPVAAVAVITFSLAALLGALISLRRRKARCPTFDDTIMGGLQ